MTNHTILGITDGVSICECCGKSDLTKAVAIQLESGDIVYYGTTCATKKHIGMSLSKIKKEADKNKAVEQGRVERLYRNTSEYSDIMQAKVVARKLYRLGRAYSDHLKPYRAASEARIKSLLGDNVYNIHAATLVGA